jgi:HEAT repeat protein
VQELAFAKREGKEIYVVRMANRMEDASARMLLGTVQHGGTWLGSVDAAPSQVVDDICDMLRGLGSVPAVVPSRLERELLALELLAPEVFARVRTKPSARDSAEVQHLLRTCGDVEGLVALLKAVTAGAAALGPVAVAAQEQMAWALRNLATRNEESKARIADAGALPPLVALLRSRSAGVQRQAAWALRCLAVSSEARQTRIADAGALPPLVALLRSGSAGVQRQAVLTMWALATGSEELKARIADEGALPPLVALLRARHADTPNHAFLALGDLATGSEARKARIEALKKAQRENAGASR